MKKIKKRGAVYGVIALLLCAAAYLNWSYVDTPEDLLAAQQTDAQADTQTDASADSTAGEGDYFASSRLTRTQARDEAVSTLKELSESDTADQSAKDDAAAQISALADDTVAEANIESLIRAKGYEDAVVMLGDGQREYRGSAAGRWSAGRGRGCYPRYRYLGDRHDGRADQNCGSVLIDSVYFYFAFYTNCAIMLLDNAG